VLKFKKLRDDVKLPTRAKAGDAGLDVYSAEEFTVNIKSGRMHKFALGLACEFPDGHVLLTQAKSGLAARYGVTTLGNVIDSGYRGEIHAILLNTGNDNVIIDPGEKIAQLILMPCWTGQPKEVKNLSDSERGSGGFGSTGNK